MDKTEKIVSAIPSAAELEQLAELHKAMGDHTRMRILWHLTQKEYCVSDLAKEIGVTESALSHQLRALRIVRLVRSRKEGKKVIYSLQDEHIGWVLEETYFVPATHQCPPDFLNDRAFWIGADIRCVHLEKIGLDMVAGLSRTTPPNDQHIQIDVSLFGVCNFSQRQTFRFGQQDILRKVRVDERLNIFCISP